MFRYNMNILGMVSVKVSLMIESLFWDDLRVFVFMLVFVVIVEKERKNEKLVV